MAYITLIIVEVGSGVIVKVVVRGGRGGGVRKLESVLKQGVWPPNIVVHRR
jgi:hypothetical protein